MSFFAEESGSLWKKGVESVKGKAGLARQGGGGGGGSNKLSAGKTEMKGFALPEARAGGVTCVLQPLYMHYAFKIVSLAAVVAFLWRCVSKIK